jgi:hypothetical protein
LSWTLANFKDAAAIFQSVPTPLARVVGGIWAYKKYILAESSYPHIESSADIVLIGQQDEYWLVELVGYLENKGSVQHKIRKFEFDLNALLKDDVIKTSEKWGNQVDFPHAVASESFKPRTTDFFFIDPGVKAKYSYVTRVPLQATFLIFHCWFEYDDKRHCGHTAERTVSISQPGPPKTPI